MFFVWISNLRDFSVFDSGTVCATCHGTVDAVKVAISDQVCKAS